MPTRRIPTYRLHKPTGLHLSRYANCTARNRPDDIGFECYSCFGSRFYSTPNIDKLARNAAKFAKIILGSTLGF